MAADEIQRNHRKLDHLQFLCGYLIKILSNFFRFGFISFCLFSVSSCFFAHTSFFICDCVVVRVVFVAVDFSASVTDAVAVLFTAFVESVPLSRW